MAEAINYADVAGRMALGGTGGYDKYMGGLTGAGVVVIDAQRNLHLSGEPMYANVVNVWDGVVDIGSLAYPLKGVTSFVSEMMFDYNDMQQTMYALKYLKDRKIEDIYMKQVETDNINAKIAAYAPFNKAKAAKAGKQHNEFSALRQLDEYGLLID